MKRLVTLAACLAFAVAVPGQAQDSGTQAAAASEESHLSARLADVVAVMNGESDPAEVFSEGFLASVSPAQLAAFNANIATQFGEALAVENVVPTGPHSATFDLRLERAIGKGIIAIDTAAPHRISTLRFTAFEPMRAEADAIAKDLAALPGKTAAWFGPLDGEAVFAHGDDYEPFAIGSTFKLYVLAAVSRAVKEGRLLWDRVVTLDTKSLPSGIMQNWPDGAPVTVHTLATLMISISDNTATDLLIDAVGRDAVEREMQLSGHSDPAASFPILKTKEAFALKASDRGAEYAAADVSRRRSILEGMDVAAMSESDFAGLFADGNPVLIDRIEWFTSMADQRALMRLLATDADATARGIMAVNTALGASEVAAWDYVGFKGGSEPGVGNLSWLLRDNQGEWHMLAVSWNDPDAEIDTPALLMIAQRILTLAD